MSNQPGGPNYPAASTPGAAPASSSNGMAIASLVLGIIGTVVGLFIPIIGVIGGVVGLILGILARRRSLSRGIVLGGIILSAIAIVVGIVGFIINAIALANLMN
ncbi:hypothetical protein [Curtobacterium sp. L1-20]|jgi:hypothetical protein|uniref:hypothetical protein n=1 Tax=Curtobacterium sp. L1-20 TaxID=3138181 RepID=UPI003B52B41B